jgi:hypothetical protein
MPRAGRPWSLPVWHCPSMRQSCHPQLLQRLCASTPRLLAWNPSIEEFRCTGPFARYFNWVQPVLNPRHRIRAQPSGYILVGTVLSTEPGEVTKSRDPGSKSTSSLDWGEIVPALARAGGSSSSLSCKSWQLQLFRALRIVPFLLPIPASCMHHSFVAPCARFDPSRCTCSSV